MHIAVGQIVRAHGIRGEVIVAVRTDEPGVRFAAGSVLPTEPPERGPLTVAASRWHSGRLIVVFEGVRDRTAAEGLRGTLLVLDSAQIRRRRTRTSSTTTSSSVSGSSPRRAIRWASSPTCCTTARICW